MSFRTLCARSTSSLICLLCGLVVFSAPGCYRDKDEVYRASANTKGELTLPNGVAPPAPAPVPDSSPKPAEAKKPAPSSGPSEKELGIPFYPGATPQEQNAQALAGLPHSEAMQLAILETPDALDKVDAFYRQQLSKAEREESVAEGQKSVEFVTLGKEAHQEVTLKQAEGKTRITLIKTIVPPTKSAVPNGTPPPTAPPTMPLTSPANGSLTK